MRKEADDMAELMLCVAGAGLMGLAAILALWREDPKPARARRHYRGAWQSAEADTAYMREWSRAAAEWAQPARRRTKRLALHARRGRKAKTSSGRIAATFPKGEGLAPLPMEWW